MSYFPAPLNVNFITKYFVYFLPVSLYVYNYIMIQTLIKRVITTRNLKTVKALVPTQLRRIHVTSGANNFLFFVIVFLM